jgi:hypothetical protein
VVDDVRTKKALATLGLFEGGQWLALVSDGTWDGSESLRTVQFAWDTDARVYRDVVPLDPELRRPGCTSRVLD